VIERAELVSGETCVTVLMAVRGIRVGEGCRERERSVIERAELVSGETCVMVLYGS
jgi:hypothetical protein